ncbi:MAG: RNA replicase beta chain [Sanya fiers-like virus 16]|nr:MAG: RNA replicase beta chain [Sanya fiers-like virus 16]
MSTFPKCLWDVVYPFLVDLDTPRSLTVKLLIEHEEFGQLVNLKADPAHYLTADAFYRDNLATELLRKCKDLETGIDTQKVALEGFFAAEKQCKRTNDRLDPFLHNGPFQDLLELKISSILDEVRSEVSRILGRIPDELDGRFGPGATFGDRGKYSTVLDKMTSQPQFTGDISVVRYFWDDTAWCRSMHLGELSNAPVGVRGNRFTTVPKDATKDRGIAIEPSLNIFAQLAVGGFIRQRLKHFGIDLKTGQDVHRAVARNGSLSGEWATLDLSSASDTVCRNLVKLVLPEIWYDLLDSLRSPLTLVEGRWVRLEKFSSMGNGFTFELETLIFLAITRVAVRHAGIEPSNGENVWVYGDDIICPAEAAQNVIAALRFCGFSTNPRKTFTDGNFRESCGGDYFKGKSVRPFYLKEYPNEPHQWIAFANGLRRVDYLHDEAYCRGSYTWRARLRALDRLPSSIKWLRGPSSFGDLIIHDDVDLWQKSPIVDGIRTFKLWLPISRAIPLEKWHPETQLAAALYGVPSRGVIPRSSVRKHRIARWPSVATVRVLDRLSELDRMEV